MVARSPRTAPCPMRLGSWDRIASRPCGRACRNRRVNSSISVVLPAPPGPVMPIVLGRALRSGTEILAPFCAAVRQTPSIASPLATPTSPMQSAGCQISMFSFLYSVRVRLKARAASLKPYCGPEISVTRKSIALIAQFASARAPLMA